MHGRGRARARRRRPGAAREDCERSGLPRGGGRDGGPRVCGASVPQGQGGALWGDLGGPLHSSGIAKR
eukprot:1598562-Pyramimonas_sp.AAC.1